MERIHVVGAGARTGTTLMAECMVACFEIDAFEKHEAQLTKHRRNVDVYLTKWPTDSALVGPRLKLDKHFHVICMIRDPRDVIVSFHSKDPDHFWTSLSHWKKQIRHVQRLAGSDRFTIVKYEDLVSEPDAVQDMIMSRLPFLRKKAAFSQFHELALPSPGAIAALGGLRPISAVRAGNWRNHLQRVAGQIARHGSISRELIEFGYEPDDAWLSLLDGVAPDMRSSHRERRRRSMLARRVKASFDAVFVAGARLFGARIV